MKRNYALFSVLALGVVLPAALGAQQSLDIGTATTEGLMPATVGVSMTNTSPVEGFVLAVGYDTTLVSVVDFSPSALVTGVGAELVSAEIFDPAGGATLGVVLDAQAPFDGQTIAAGTGQGIAEMTVMPDLIVGAPTVVALDFVDGTFNNPPLDNIIVEGGLSIGAGQGLGLNGGSVTLNPPPPDQLVIEDTTIASNSCGPVRILMSNSSGPVQGFVLAIQHDGLALELTGINISGTVTEAAPAEFVVPNIVDPLGGGTLGVVLDFEPPFDGQTIPLGNDQHIANFVYCCQTEIVEPDPDQTTVVSFVDGLLGTPPLDNVIVVAGLSLNPGLTDGTITCAAVPPPPPVDSSLYCGQQAPDGTIVDVTGSPGDTVSMCFFYTDEDDNIQGFQLAVCFDCNLEFVEGTFSIAGSILEAVGAEFVNHHVDNDPNDGDGCEFVAGILLDALPPFEGQTVPPTVTPLLIGCIDVVISPDAPCNTCLDVHFCDGINGRGTVPIENIMVIDNQSVQDLNFFNCSICVVSPPEFTRGDCNGDTKVDLADAQAILSQQFAGFPAPCLDACDANDDGKINLADTVFVLNYLFKFQDPPPAPFPDPGPDPTEDDLDCEGGNDPCPNP